MTSMAFLAFSLASSLASILLYKKIFLVSILTKYNKNNYLGGNYLREETIQGRKLVSKKASKGRKLFKGGNYKRADTIQGNTVTRIPKLHAQPDQIWGRVIIGLGKGYRCQGQIFTPVPSLSISCLCKM